MSPITIEELRQASNEDLQDLGFGKSGLFHSSPKLENYRFNRSSFLGSLHTRVIPIRIIHQIKRNSFSVSP